MTSEVEPIRIGTRIQSDAEREPGRSVSKFLFFCPKRPELVENLISSLSPMILYRCFWNVIRGQGSWPAIQGRRIRRKASMPARPESSEKIKRWTLLLLLLIFLSICFFQKIKKQTKTNKRKKKQHYVLKNRSAYLHSLQVRVCVFVCVYIYIYIYR